MFVEGDVVKILYCPTHPFINGLEGILVKQASRELLNRDNLAFSPTAWEDENAFWTVLVGFEEYNAYVRHDFAIGDMIIVNKAPIGWKELEGRQYMVEQISSRKPVVRTARNLSVNIEDFTPVKIKNKSPESKPEEVPPSENVSKTEIAETVLAITGTDLGNMSEDMLELLKQLGVSLADHADVTAETYISLEIHEKIKFGKGIDINDHTAVASQLASKFKAMATSELASYLLECIEGVDALS